METYLPSLFHEMSELSTVKAFTADFELQHFIRRELESLAREHLADAIILAGFGGLREFLPHRKTYEAIAEEVRAVWVYAKDDAGWMEQSPKLHHIELPNDSLLVDEPFFLIVSRGKSLGMVSRTISSETQRADPLPDFDILLSFDNEWVARAIQLLSLFAPETPDLELPISTNIQETAEARMIARVIARLARIIGELRSDYNNLLRQYDTLLEAANSDSGQDPDSWLLTSDRFHERLDQNMQLARRHEHPLSVLTVAVERVEPGVKSEELRALGAAIDCICRKTDFIGHLRHGVIAIGSPMTDETGMQTVKERLRRQLEIIAEELGGGELTIGIATRDKTDAATADDLLVYAEIDRLQADSES